MAIKDPLMFITIEEFKNWKGFNKSLFDEVTTPDSEIRYAIEIASSNIDFLSGFTISKKWPEINPTKFTDNIQTATTHYVNFLLGKGVEYARGQASIGQGGITYSQNNPEDPYYIVPQVFNYLKEINEYPIMQGFNLNVSSKQNWFKKFMGNGGEQNPWEIYVQFTNIKSSDDRTKITITHPKNIMGSVLDIDTRGIKSFDNLTTLELFTKYFSNDTMKLVDGKKGQEKKVISATSGNSLWEVDKDNTNFIKSKDDKGISANDKRIIDVGTPTFLSDATTKEYVDKKQDKLIAGENIKIDEKTNTISATGGSSVDENRIFNNKDDKNSTTRLVNEIIKTNVGGKTLIYRNEPVITDDLDIPNKKYMDDAIKYAFQLNAIGTEISGLETKNKTIVGGINEIDKKIKDFKIGKWKEVGTISSDKTNITYNFIRDKRYKVYYNWGQSPSPNVIKEFIFDASNNNYLESFIEENNKISILWLQDNKIFINQKGRNYGYVSKLEEYQEENTYQINSKTLDIMAPTKINIEKPIKINSYSLETNEIRENEWDIELKNNPTPSIPQWKEVGIKVNINHIRYNFITNKKYKIYYNFESQSSSKKFAFMSKEFLYGELNTDVQTLYWDKVNERIIISLQMQNDTIAIVSDPTRYGQLLKLEELQE